MKDAVLTICPKELCRQKTWGKGKVKRQIGSGAGLIFKGTGFYITDYRSEGYKAAAKQDTGSSTESKSSEGGKSSETKEAPKATEPKPAEKKTETKPASAEKPKSNPKAK
jgi:predicted nucleic acid-binding Zn ribbon protein